MHQGKYTIESNQKLADGTFRMHLLGDTSAFTCGGQFADIAIDGFFLRRPLAAQKWDEDGFYVIYKVVGKGTDKLSSFEKGAVLDVLTGLGNGYDAAACRESALVVAGSLGVSPLFTLTRDLLAAGKRVTAILGFNSAKDVILEDEYRALGADTIVVTVDGSKGVMGLVTDYMPEGWYDYFYTCGPKVMMKAVCEKAGVSGEASLEERMGCGCGICYGCTCHTAQGAKRICADGPVFKKEDIIW